MTLAADIAGDYSVMDGTEAVTLTPQNPAGTPASGVTALRRVLSKRDLMGIGIEPSDLVWHLWVSTLGGTVPKQGDKITDAGSVSYLIQNLELDTLGTRWRCIARKTV